MRCCAVCGQVSRRGFRIRWRWRIGQYRCRSHWRPAMGAGGPPAYPTIWARIARWCIHLLNGITPEEYAHGVRPKRVLA